MARRLQGKAHVAPERHRKLHQTGDRLFMNLRFSFTLAWSLLVAVPGVAQVQPLEQTQAPAKARPAPPPPLSEELVSVPADATRLPSGLAYKVLREGKPGGSPPLDKDVVAVFVLGRSPNGEVFHDSFGQGKAQRMQVKHTFPAWREAMRSMVPGEIRRWWFPADAVPPNPKTGRRELAVFDVELVDVGRIPDPPRSVSEPDPKARRLPSGVAVLLVNSGKGPRKLGRSDGALVSFTCWLSDGRAVNSSIAEGHPTLFPMDKVMSGFADCLEGMRLSEKRYCWLPAERNEGFPGAPPGALVFELELLDILDVDALLSGKGREPRP